MPPGSAVPSGYAENGDNEGGNYFRHYTDAQKLQGIKEDGSIWMSRGDHLEHGPGVYFTTQLDTAASVRVTGSNGSAWVDVWVPKDVQWSSGWHNWGDGQYTYTYGNFPTHYFDTYHPTRYSQ